jgi:hypothetical protein
MGGPDDCAFKVMQHLPYKCTDEVFILGDEHAPAAKRILRIPAHAPSVDVDVSLCGNSPDLPHRRTRRLALESTRRRAGFPDTNQ